MTCVFSTAYLEEAEAADRVLLFESGRIIADENPQTFISRAKGRTYLLPLANRAEHDAQMLCRRLSEETAATRSDALFLDIVPRMGGAAATTLAPTLPVKDARVPTGFVPRQPSLEDAYALLTFPRAPKTANRLASPRQTSPTLRPMTPPSVPSSFAPTASPASSGILWPSLTPRLK